MILAARLKKLAGRFSQPQLYNFYTFLYEFALEMPNMFVATDEDRLTTGTQWPYANARVAVNAINMLNHWVWFTKTYYDHSFEYDELIPIFQAIGAKLFSKKTPSKWNLFPKAEVFMEYFLDNVLLALKKPEAREQIANNIVAAMLYPDNVLPVNSKASLLS